MDTLTWILIAFSLFMLARSLFADRSPIPETSGKVHKVGSAAELDALLASTARVVVDFYADWCPPCRAIAPVFSDLAEAHASPGRLAFAKVNVDRVRNVAGRYGVSAMPTFLFFQDAAPRGVKVGGEGEGEGEGEGDGGKLVERVLGADRGALVAAVKAMAAS
ncbi:thioredoxin [Xylariomycetidae sp. FL2044]|nr:thioredoxin [Xylariomycetidae sp. FL2044]